MMNKTLCAMAACLAMGTAVAEVTSANIVGYTTQSLEANKFYLVGSTFENTTGDAKSIQEFITGDGLIAGSDEYDSSLIQYWNGVKLMSLIYLDGAWDPDALDGEGDFVVAWADPLEMEAVKMDVPTGFGCWIKLPAAGNITYSGQVAELVDDLTLTPAWQLVGNPYPTATKFNGGKMDCSLLTPGSDEYDSPVIQYWNGIKLMSLIYLDGAWDPDALDGEGDFVVAWADPLEMEAVKLTLDPCMGFWIKDPNSGTIKWPK